MNREGGKALQVPCIRVTPLRQNDVCHTGDGKLILAAVCVIENWSTEKGLESAGREGESERKRSDSPSAAVVNRYCVAGTRADKARANDRYDNK